MNDPKNYSSISVEQVLELYELPMNELMDRAAQVHQKNFPEGDIELATLLSIKTGGCPEDCGYCPQAARYHTDVKATKLMDVEEVLEAAKAAKEAGSNRFCMGAAWREPKDRDIEKVVAMIKGVKDLGLETCATLGMLAPEQAKALLKASGLSDLAHPLDTVRVDPCWTLMLAYPQASQPGLTHLGPQWNAARSTHHRIAWLARESSKPGRSSIERWTVQASAEWSMEHLNDDAERVQNKLQRAFAELTGIHTAPSHAQAHLWRYAKTVQPLGKKHLWDPKLNLGVCGDWLLGHRVEDAFVSGLSLALRIADKKPVS